MGMGVAAGCEVLYILNWWSCWVTAILGCVQVKEACPDQGWHAESWRHETTQSESAEVRKSMIEQEQEWEMPNNFSFTPFPYFICESIYYFAINLLLIQTSQVGFSPFDQ